MLIIWKWLRGFVGCGMAPVVEQEEDVEKGEKVPAAKRCKKQ